jgi:pimeloyl-ACP methyl ester carboxylesterase
LKGTAVAVVTAEASPAAQRDPQVVGFLTQAGIAVDRIVLADAGVRGNGPYPMLERNNREALAPILAWLERRTSTGAPAIVQPPLRSNSDSTALRLADHNYFFVGIEKKSSPNGTVVYGQSGVQVFTPAEVRHPYPVILVHGGLGQAVHMMGIGRRPGWVHYFVREGYRTYVMDRPAYGRVPMHPETFGDYFTGYGGGTNLANILRNSAMAPGTPRNTGLAGEELGLQFVANESGFPRSMAQHSEQWAKGAVELLDRIGPSIMLTHAWGGTLGWIAADRRPNLVKAVVTVESNNAPFEGEVVWGVTAVPLTFDPPVTDPKEFRLTEWTPPAGSPGPNRAHRVQAEPARQLKNLRDIPILWMQGENNYSGPAQVQFLKQSGVDAEFLRLRDRGIEGNTNLMVLERNNFEVFSLIRDWLAGRVR